MALDPDIQEYFDFKYVEGELHIYIRQELVRALGWTDKELEMSFGGIKRIIRLREHISAYNQYQENTSTHGINTNSML